MQLLNSSKEMLVLPTHVLSCVAGSCCSEENGKQLSCLCESSANNGANFEPLGGRVICFILIHSIKMWILYCILGLLDNVTCLWAESASNLCVDHTSKLLLSFLMSGAAGSDQHLELILWKLRSFSKSAIWLSGLFIPDFSIEIHVLFN